MEGANSRSKTPITLGKKVTVKRRGSLNDVDRYKTAGNKIGSSGSKSSDASTKLKRRGSLQLKNSTVSTSKSNLETVRENVSRKAEIRRGSGGDNLLRGCNLDLDRYSHWTKLSEEDVVVVCIYYRLEVNTAKMFCLVCI